MDSELRSLFVVRKAPQVGGPILRILKLLPPAEAGHQVGVCLFVNRSIGDSFCDQLLAHQGQQQVVASKQRQLIRGELRQRQCVLLPRRVGEI